MRTSPRSAPITSLALPLLRAPKVRNRSRESEDKSPLMKSDRLKVSTFALAVGLSLAAGPRAMAQAPCTPGPSGLCLNSNRFRLTLLTIDQRTGRTGEGQAIPQNDKFGYFSIPALTNDPDNPEVFVKLLDGTAINGHFWVFYGGLTDLEYFLAVTDTTTGAVKTYRKEPGSAAGGFDTAAFSNSVAPPPTSTVVKRGVFTGQNGYSTVGSVQVVRVRRRRAPPGSSRPSGEPERETGALTSP